MGAAAAPATGTGAIMDPDTRVAMEVKDAIKTDADLSSMKIDVSSQDGAVTLRGRAPDPAARDRATDLARSVREVKSVENLLTLG
jgi:osmotically-inducible protein OsmY